MLPEVVPGLSTNGTHLGQGKEKSRNYLIENKDVCEEIRRKVLEAGGYVEDMSEVLEGIDKDAKAHLSQELMDLLRFKPKQRIILIRKCGVVSTSPLVPELPRPFSTGPCWAGFFIAKFRLVMQVIKK